jgi:hypothetical protein
MFELPTEREERLYKFLDGKKRYMKVTREWGTARRDDTYCQRWQDPVSMW